MPRGIFAIFMAFGIAIAGGSSFYYAWCWSQVLDGRGWPSTQGRILSIDVEDHVGHDNDGHETYTYYPRLTYSYRVQGRMLVGRRIWVSGNEFYQHRESAVAFVQNYAIGQNVPVIYDPEDPDRAALLIEDPPWQILIFTAFGIVWMAASLGFRFWDPNKRRFGKCRKCGARLPFDEHVSFRDSVPAEIAAKMPEAKPCPHCGQVDPLNSLRNKPGCILFAIAFAAVWGVILYVFFFLG
jgi:hypothetical protein